MVVADQALWVAGDRDPHPHGQHACPRVQLLLRPSPTLAPAWLHELGLCSPQVPRSRSPSRASALQRRGPQAGLAEVSGNEEPWVESTRAHEQLLAGETSLVGGSENQDSTCPGPTTRTSHGK